ncbi:MAG: FecR domain-containing protein [Oleibacter sp.]|nr:FecR domain-containing protein [Thalassolituus sp.]
MSAALGPSRSLYAAIALLIAIPLFVFLFLSPKQGETSAGMDSISTAAGEVRSIAIEGGSKIQLSENSQISLRISDDQQRVRLVTGEATFVVMEDPLRPFWVQAGDFRLRAATSAFRMTLLDKQLTLQVLEGSVRAQWTGNAQTLTAGERILIDL